MFIVIGVALAFISPNSLISASIAVPAVSAVIDMNAAEAINQKAKPQPAAPQA